MCFDFGYIVGINSFWYSKDELLHFFESVEALRDADDGVLRATYYAKSQQEKLVLILDKKSLKKVIQHHPIRPS